VSEIGDGRMVTPTARCVQLPVSTTKSSTRPILMSSASNTLQNPIWSSLETIFITRKLSVSIGSFAMDAKVSNIFISSQKCHIRIEPMQMTIAIIAYSAAKVWAVPMWISRRCSELHIVGYLVRSIPTCAPLP